MGILFKRKMAYFLVAVLVLLCMCLRGDLLVVEGDLYSVLDVIREQGQAGVMSPSASNAFGSGVTFWMYLLLPVASIPFVSFLAEERSSRYHFFEKLRRGTLRDLSAKLVFAFAGSAVILFVVIVAYAAIVCCHFDFAASGGLLLFVRQVLAKYAYVLVYSFSLSCMGGVLVYIYNDLYVDMSIMMVLNYLLKDVLIRDRLAYPLAGLALTAVLYAAVRKTRCDKI